MKTVRRLDYTGDTAISFNDGEAAEAEAKALFEEHVGKKLPAFTANPGKEAVKIASFNEIKEGDEVLLIPAVVAG